MLKYSLVCALFFCIACGIHENHPAADQNSAASREEVRRLAEEFDAKLAQPNSELWTQIIVELDPVLEVDALDLSWVQVGRRNDAYDLKEKSFSALFSPQGYFESDAIAVYCDYSNGKAKARALVHHFRDFGPPFSWLLKIASGTLHLKSYDFNHGVEGKLELVLQDGTTRSASFKATR